MTGGQRVAVLVQEEEVEGEAHAEGVDAPAPRDQQAGAGPLALQEGEAKQPRAESDRNWDLEPEHEGDWKPPQARRQ